MFGRAVRVLPVVRGIAQQQCVQQRNIWDLTKRNVFDLPQLSNLRSMVRDMDNTMDRLQRDFLNMPFLTQISPRLIPIHGGDKEFRLNIDVQGFKPEEVTVNVNNNMLTVTGKMERTDEDGSKYQQEFTRQMTLPKNLVTKELKSYLNPSGLLTIEAPLDVKVNEIPVKHLGTGEGEVVKK